MVFKCRFAFALKIVGSPFVSDVRTKCLCIHDLYENVNKIHWKFMVSMCIFTKVTFKHLQYIYITLQLFFDLKFIDSMIIAIWTSKWNRQCKVFVYFHPHKHKHLLSNPFDLYEIQNIIEAMTCVNRRISIFSKWKIFKKTESLQ